MKKRLFFPGNSIVESLFYSVIVLMQENFMNVSGIVTTHRSWIFVLPFPSCKAKSLKLIPLRSGVGAIAQVCDPSLMIIS